MADLEILDLPPAELAQRRRVLSLLSIPEKHRSVDSLKRLYACVVRARLHRTCNFAVGNLAARCAALGLMPYALRMFEQMPEPNSFVWNTLIRGFQQNRRPEVSLLFFGAMRARGVVGDRFTFLNAFRACADMQDLRRGRWVQGQLVKVSLGLDARVGSCLIEFYSACEDMAAARQVFDEMPLRDAVSWTVTVSGYVNVKCDMEGARKLFEEMPVKDLVVWSVVIAGYVKAGDVGAARDLFDRAPRKDLLMYNTMLGGYARSGEADGLLRLFEEMPERDVVSWNTAISSLVQRGRIREACALFQKMQQLENQRPNERENVRPNGVTMVGVLSACAHAGMVDEGRRCFEAMRRELAVAPGVEHYGCMVDLLGRAGRLREAYELARSMPVPPHAGVWGALLGACRIHAEVELAERSLERLLELDLDDNGGGGTWQSLRELMRKKGVVKAAGRSSVEINGEVHEFAAGDEKHPRRREIYEMVDEISARLRRDYDGVDDAFINVPASEG
ncbi:unnamed protein product [Spirodela intermedia]|uniref:Uncharacterized protein n=1 Tax=Spirodela intermedia TaxID=51605 RepID=A0A7I8IB76_SPIIN|nr:unnamed protein product [Spirodela intermedia]CAA6654996.1 unnamed protein product [Spirodela intermedia]